MEKRVKFYVGVGCIVTRNKEVLLGLREAKEGNNTWSVPGGHIEYGESPITAAHRELFEEAKMVAQNAYQLATFTSYDDNTPRVQIVYKMLNVTGNQELVPGEGFSYMRYFSLENLPSNMFAPTRIALAIQRIKSNS